MSKHFIALYLFQGTLVSIFIKYCLPLFKRSQDLQHIPQKLQYIQSKFAKVESELTRIQQHIDELQQSIERIDKKESALQASTDLHQRLDEFIKFNYEVLE